MKTAKYFIEFDYCENGMCSPMEISKKEFQQQLSYMRNQIEATKDDESPIVEFDPQKGDLPSMETTTYIFHSGCARTFLTAFKCKPGYRFKKENEK